MQTRRQTKRAHEANGLGEEEEMKCVGNADKFDDSETLSNVSKDAVGRLLKRVKGRGRQGLKEVDDTYLRKCDSPSMLESELKKKKEQCIGTTVITNDQYCGRRVTTNVPLDSASRDEHDEPEWEEGSIPILNSMNSSLEHAINGVTVEFDVSPDPAKRKPIRRATAEEKELAELVHKVNLLCLLGRGRLFDDACSDPLIQASLLSLLPPHLLKIAEVPKLTSKTLTPLVSWFHNRFCVRGPGSTKKTPNLALASTLEAYEGTAEEVAALSVALFRALNLSTRYVALLDVVPLKPEVDKPESSGQGSGRAGSVIFNSPTLMVARSGHTSVSPSKTPASDDKHGDCRTSVPGESKFKSRKLLKDNSEDKYLSVDNKLKGGMVDPSTSEPQYGISDGYISEKSEGQVKGKGDLEFEMQLEMALSATAIENSKKNASSKNSPSLEELKAVRMEDSPVSTSAVSTAIGSRKAGAPLYWAEVYCPGENLTGKWVHIDVVNAIVDGEQKVEAAAAACKTSLRYVVAFAGRGAKDVTRRYCTKWYKIASQRVTSMWWDAVLAPLKQLESQATGGIVHLEQGISSTNQNAKALQVTDNQIQESSTDDVHITRKSNREACEDFTVKKESGCLSNSFAATRSSLEDMELDTRVLTEPLPTNQQAYRHHPLYVIERWLNNYQMLYPKGPVLGLCSGHPVYPRTCVQMLHTKERWLREGCQVKANELPAKILKRSLKQRKVQTGEDDECIKGDQVALYGNWQTEPLCLPHAVDGIVPKNERGQVDVWSEKCLPPGTVHLTLPRVALVAKRLEIDYAPAMVGFEFRNGRSIPVFEGIVVCTEFEDAILEAYDEEEERREAEERKRNEAQALSRWYQLLSSFVTRQRLKNCYGDGAPSQGSAGIPKQDNRSHAGVGGSQDGRKSPKCLQENLPDNKLVAPQFVPTEDHQHVFILDVDNSNGESSTRTKRCQCGFSIECEEL